MFRGEPTEQHAVAIFTGDRTGRPNTNSKEKIRKSEILGRKHTRKM